MEPITELPAGLVASYTDCPCAKGVGAIWVGEHMYWVESSPTPKPHGIGHFIEFFDENGARGMLTNPIRKKEGT